MPARDRPLRDFHAPPTITAALGPTNTGKTRRAIQRMLGHADGMIGLPLRLLAREVYERCVEKVGVDQVALITGEEKLVPDTARYWVCTTESMPVNRVVDFVAIDEIQLATHRERGHVFTDRLLHLRGRRETWFMGSDAMVPVMNRLVPTAEVERYERFSKLSHAGVCRLGALPPRSAVIGFSAAHVYELAEKLRVKKGGAAVVLGALSPAPATVRSRCMPRARCNTWWPRTPSAWGSTSTWTMWRLRRCPNLMACRIVRWKPPSWPRSRDGRGATVATARLAPWRPWVSWTRALSTTSPNIASRS